MASPMRVRASEAGGVTDVKVLMKHDMETGQRKDASGATVPAWYITDITVKHIEKVVFMGQFGPSISKDPFLNVKFKGGAKGDDVSVTWVDTKGETRTDSAKIG